MMMRGSVQKGIPRHRPSEPLTEAIMVLMALHPLRAWLEEIGASSSDVAAAGGRSTQPTSRVPLPVDPAWATPDGRGRSTALQAKLRINQTVVSS